MKIMKYMILALAFVSLVLHACSDDEENKVVPVVKPDATGTWTDPRDNSVYRWMRYGNQEWLSENMRIFPATGSASKTNQDDTTDEEFQQYGYLYDFDAANSIAVGEWRLPSEKDWQALERYFGMPEEEIAQTGWRGDFIGTLLMQDATGSGLTLRCGGYGHSLGGFGTRAFGTDGIYWSSTPDETTNGYAWCRMITFNKDKVRRETMITKRYMSVRLVRDVK